MFPAMFGCMPGGTTGLKLPAGALKREQQIRPMPQKRPAEAMMSEALNMINGSHSDAVKVAVAQQSAMQTEAMAVQPVITAAMELPNDSVELKEFLR